jgi:hypothetical protein
MIGLLCFVLAVLASPFKSKSRLYLSVIMPRWHRVGSKNRNCAKAAVFQLFWFWIGVAQQACRGRLSKEIRQQGVPGAADQCNNFGAPWQCLNFLPEPQDRLIYAGLYRLVPSTLNALTLVLLSRVPANQSILPWGPNGNLAPQHMKVGLSRAPDGTALQVRLRRHHHHDARTCRRAQRFLAVAGERNRSDGDIRISRDPSGKWTSRLRKMRG